METESEMPLSGKKIGIFGKGGSGKSTCAVLFAKTLKERRYEVCVLDADSTNFGIPQALGIVAAPDSLIDYFGGMVFRGGAVTCPVDDPTPLNRAVLSLERFDRRYWDQNRAGIVLLVAGKMGEQGPGEGCDGPLSKIARDIKIETPEGRHPVILIDFKAGFEDSARGVITGLDWAVVIVDPTSASIQMAINMKKLVAQIKAGDLPATSHLSDPDLIKMANRLYAETQIRGIVFVLNKIADEETEIYLREKLAKEGIEPLGVIREDRSISASWLRGKSLDFSNETESAQDIIMGLEKVDGMYTR